MYYYNKRSSQKTVHIPGCHHLANKSEEFIGVFGSLGSAYAGGYCLCERCSPIASRFRAEQKRLESYCGYNEIDVFYSTRWLDVVMEDSRWRIVPDDETGGLNLYHRNTYESWRDYLSPLEGYHLQNAQSDTIIGFLKYINAHDKYRKRLAEEELRAKKRAAEQAIMAEKARKKAYNAPPKLALPSYALEPAPPRKREDTYQKIKGTQKYRIEQKKAKEKAKRAAIKNVLDLIDSLHS